jgi:hypothetical protein
LSRIDPPCGWMASPKMVTTSDFARGGSSAKVLWIHFRIV